MANELPDLSIYPFECSLLERQRFKRDITGYAKHAVWQIALTEPHPSDPEKRMRLDDVYLDTYTTTPPYTLTCNAFYAEIDAADDELASHCQQYRMVLAENATDLSSYGEIDGFEMLDDIRFPDSSIEAKIYKSHDGLQEAVSPDLPEEVFSHLFPLSEELLNTYQHNHTFYNTSGRSSNGTYILEPDPSAFEGRSVPRPFIITVSDSPKEAIFQSALAQTNLSNQGIPVPPLRVLSLSPGKRNTAYLVSDFIDGHHFRSVGNRLGLQKQHIAKLADALARIHALPAETAEPPIMLHVVPTETVLASVEGALSAAENGEAACDAATMCFSAIAALLEKMPVEKMQELYPDLYQEFLSYSDAEKALLLPEETLEGSFPEGWNHNDLHPLNVIQVLGEEANEQGKIVLIDFQRTGRGRFVDELAQALYFFCVDEETGKLDPELTRVFFNTYCEIRNNAANLESGNSALSKEEVAALSGKISRIARRQALPTWEMLRSRSREEYVRFAKRNDVLPAQMEEFDTPEAFFNAFIYDRQNEGPSFADLADYKPVLPSFAENKRVKNYFLRAVQHAGIGRQLPEWSEDRAEKTLNSFHVLEIPKDKEDSLTILVQPPLQQIQNRPRLFGQQLHSRVRAEEPRSGITLTIGRMDNLSAAQERDQWRRDMEAAGVNSLKPLTAPANLPRTSYFYMLEPELPGRGAPLRDRHMSDLADNLARMHGISASRDTALPTGLCHNALRAENIFCDPTPIGKQVTLGGLHQLAVGECINDVVSAIQVACIEETGELDFQKVSLFLNKYSAAREQSTGLSLTREEFTEIPGRLVAQLRNESSERNNAIVEQLTPYVDQFTAFASALREYGLNIPLQPAAHNASSTHPEEISSNSYSALHIKKPEDIPDNLIGFMKTQKYKDAKAVAADLWGVVNDDTGYYAEAIETINRIKQDGKKIVIVSNSPFKNDTIEKRLLGFGLRLGEDYDAIVTSGDITHGIFEQRNESLLRQKAKEKYLLIGNQEHSRELIADLHQFEVTENPEEADFILCTAAPNNRQNPKEDEALQALLEQCRDVSQRTGKPLPMFNANPDLECPDSSGHRIYCGGMVAQMYENMGGQVTTYGKPNPSIYKKAAMAIGLYDVDKPEDQQTYPQEMIAVGDSLKTDIAGANKAGIYSVLIRNDLHYHELPRHISPLDVKYLTSQFRTQNAYPDAIIKSFSVDPAKQRYSSVPEVIPDYDAVLLNWGGVLGDDSGFFNPAVETLKQLQHLGKQVVIITNTPFPSSYVEERLREKGVIKGKHYSGILTAGEIAHEHFAEQSNAERPQKYCLISGEEDSASLLDDLAGYERINGDSKHVTVEELAQADFVLCTSCPDKHNAPENYFMDDLQRIKESGLRLYDVNSDLRTPQKNGVEVYCGGSIATLYREKLDGEVYSFGKPTSEFYVKALEMLEPNKRKILMVDDSFQSIEGIQQLEDVHQVKIDTLLVRGRKLGTPEKPRLDVVEGSEWNDRTGNVTPPPHAPRHVAPDFGNGRRITFVLEGRS